MAWRGNLLASVGVVMGFCSVVSFDAESLSSLKYETPFTWKTRDGFDDIMDKMTSVNAENCKSKSESDLVMPSDAVSQVPRYNELHKNIFYQNRTALVHMLNMAFNRALFYSYIFQAQNASEAEFKNNPGLLYYYMSSTADISANPGFINGSSIYFDNNCHYPNWLSSVVFNVTIPLFAPSAWRVDDYNEPTNHNREPTNNTVDVQDYGAGVDSNYSHPLYKPNLWYKQWLPDLSSAKDTLRKFTRGIGIQASNSTGHLQLKTDTPFFGPPEPKESDLTESLPVRFTDAYFDCGRSNRWIISATSPVVDYLARYVTNITIVRRPRIVAVIVMDTEFESLDINQCDLGFGHIGPNRFAGTHRCKPTTNCEPMFGFGFRRGGYQCTCKAEYRLPYWQDGPFLGVELEEATEDEWRDGFDCIAIGEKRIVPQEMPTIVGRKGVQKTAVIRSDVDRATRSVKPSLLEEILAPFTSRKSKRSVDSDNEPHVKLVSRSAEHEPIVKLVSRKTRSADHEPNVKLVSRKKRSAEHEPKVKLVSRKKRSFDQRKLERTQKNFDNDAFQRMMRLRRRRTGVTGKNCKARQPQHLLLPGDVSYGVEKTLEPQARVALRLAHFLSNYLQNVVENEMFGTIIGDRNLHESQMWGEVMANVMGDRKIKGSGVFFDRYKYRMSTPFNNSNPRFEKGITRELFGPYAYRVYEPQENRDTESTLDKYSVLDMAGLPEDERYVSKRWFMDMKSRWATNFYHLKKFRMRPMVRYNMAGSSRVRFEYYPMMYRAPKYEDGVWLRPTFKCDDRVMDWVVTYVVPFFGVNALRTRLDFKGVVTVDVKLLELDINQCPDDFAVANAYKATARCDFATTYCVPLRGERFKLGSYKCECKQGYEQPFSQFVSFDGAMMEKEYKLYVKGEPNRFDTLKCRLAGADHARNNLWVLSSMGVVSLLTLL